MLRRSLFACALMLAGVVGFASNAKAAPAAGDVTQPVTFTGTVPTTCTLTNPVPGTLGVSGDNKVLSSTIGSGTAATIDINCTGGAISVGAPSKTAGSASTTADADIETKTAKLTMTGGTSVNSGEAPIPVANGAATVDMAATDTSAALVAGDYTFTVILTATPGS